MPGHVIDMHVEPSMLEIGDIPMTWHAISATSSKHVSKPRSLNDMAPYDVVSTICQSLPRRFGLAAGRQVVSRHPRCAYTQRRGKIIRHRHRHPA